MVVLSVAVAALSVAVAGCGSGGSTYSRVAATPANAPGCSTAIAPQHRLHGVRTALRSMGSSPFGIVTAPRGGWSFLADEQQGTIDVLSDHTFMPRIVHKLALPDHAAVGETITRDGRYVLGADGSGAVVVDTARAEQGRPGAVLGELSLPNPTAGAIEVTTSADGRYAFVTLEGAGRVAVFDLAAALARHFRTSGYVGAVPAGIAPVGMALSPDGRWLYTTSEAGAGPHGRYGLLSVIDVHTAETDPSHAVVSRAVAGCGAVRVAVSSDGATVWVTARESDALLAFSAARLRSDPGHALRADVRVGEAPVGLALVDDDSRIVVADSNRFSVSGQAELTVVNAAAALAGHPAVAGSLPAGAFPREESLEPGSHTLLVSNFTSGQLEAVDTARLP
jgi:DNA-binding beta-propeller fold protein YncE